MARLKLELPDSFIFSTELRVRISDINYGNHLGHDRILSMMHEARVRLLNKYGFTELNIDGAGIMVTDVLVNYKSEAYYGEILKVEIAIGDIMKKGCDFIYRISEKISNREVARAKAGVVFFDYMKRRMVTIPEIFKEKCISKTL